MLDGGLSRVPQPVDRRTVRRADSPRRQADNQPSQKDSRPSSGPQPSQPKNRPSSKPKQPLNRLKKILMIGLAVVLALALGWIIWTSLFSGVTSTIDGGKKQAVLLTNGQTYFGNLEIVDSKFVKISDVFYVQTDETSTQDQEEAAPAASNSMRLVKRGQEVFGPEDAMMISRDQILYFENIKDDSQVSQLMRDYQSNN